MDADDLLREAVSAAVDEVLADPLLDPEREVERLQSLVSSMFWPTYYEREPEGPAVDDGFDMSIEYDGMWGGSDVQNEQTAQEEARYEAEVFGQKE